MRRRAAIVVLLCLSLSALAACTNPAEPSDPNVVKVNGTVRFATFEGGFWYVLGDDKVPYDPLDTLPPAFRVEGLRIRLEARKRPDMISVHGAGPIVEIISIVKLQ